MHNVSSPAVDTLGRLAKRRARLKMGWCINAGCFIVVVLVNVYFALLHGNVAALQPPYVWTTLLGVHGVLVYGMTGANGHFAKMVQRERTALGLEQA